MLSAMTLPVDITGSYNTGVALFNPGSSTVPVTLKLLDAKGVIMGTTQRTLPVLNHIASFADEFFPGTTGFRGSLAITAVGNVAASTLRQYASGATYTTLPIVAGTATGTMPATPLLPQAMTDISSEPRRKP